jgi:hypothetical protein
MAEFVAHQPAKAMVSRTKDNPGLLSRFIAIWYFYEKRCVSDYLNV